MEPIIMRAIERILAVLIGGLSVYWGYSLFLHLPQQSDSAGKIILPGNISIYLSRVGPGIFLALFGVVVVALSLHKAIIYSDRGFYAGAPAAEQDTTMVHPKSNGRYYSGLGETETKGDRQSLEKSRTLLRRDLFFLNTLSKVLKTDLSDAQQVDINLTLPRIKLDLMKAVWDEDWGDYVEFKKWVLEGDENSPPQGFKTAAEYFHYGRKEGRHEGT